VKCSTPSYGRWRKPPWPAPSARVPTLYPAVEVVHLAGLALLIGSATAFDLRLLGVSRALSVRTLGTHLERMEQIMRDVCADFECELAEFNGESNHVHLLVHFPPKVALSRLVNSLKGVSSRRLRQEFPELARHYYRGNKLWSGSYFADSVGGAPISVLRQYIEQQNRPV